MNAQPKFAPQLNGSLELHTMIDIFSEILRKLQYYFAEIVKKLFQNVKKTYKISEAPLFFSSKKS